MDEIVLDSQQRMEKSIESLRASLVTLRTGRANPAILSTLMIDYYGSPTPVNQISSISVPEPRQLLIKPYDRNDMKAILTAINASSLGLNPINEGTSIRLMIPTLTEDRRRELSKQAKKYGEEAKVAIRNIRRDYVDLVKSDDTYPEDYQKKILEDIQKVTDEAIQKIDDICQEKEKEIMVV
ncbi:MAG: ribosome recycling factor [Bacilli bacterium]|jgi:ribosome recycling factor|nr:ribosome recycling factor [Bacilli bacterium]MDD3841271.1 ribosome recycling factor [Bacilli bacterium]HKM10215.1 ribosome recycling factor [Bacilli bacterium]